MILRVKDWDAVFENAASRKLVRLAWVPVPNKMDGEGYTSLVDHPNGAAHLGAWLAIMEIASKQEPRSERGKLPGGPHHDLGMICRSLGRISRLPASLFEEVLPRLMAAPILWLEVLSNEQSATPSGESATVSGDSPERKEKKRKELEEKEPPIPPTVIDVAKEQTNAPTGACTGLSVPGVIPISHGIMARPTVRASRDKRTVAQIKAALGPERLTWWENFWQVFPCRQSMREGLEAFERKVTTRELAVAVYQGARRYAALYAAQPDMRLKYAQGWINGERWNDECALPQPALNQYQERNRQTLSAMKMLEQMRNSG